MTNDRRWTPQEDELLLADNGMSVGEKAKALGRTYYAACFRRKTLRAPRTVVIPEGSLSTMQVAELLGIHPTTVTNWATAGTLPPPTKQPRRGSGGIGLWDKNTITQWAAWRNDLIDIPGIATWLGRSVPTIYAWAREKPLPPPALTEGKKKLWEWPNIQDWADHFIEWEEDQ